MTADSITVLIGGVGTIAFLAWFFFGPRKGTQVIAAESRSWHSPEAAPVASAEEQPARERCDLAVKGMHCASCVGRVENALKRVPGVEEAAVNLLAERASVQYNPRRANPQDLMDAVEATGYKAQIASLDPFGSEAK